MKKQGYQSGRLAVIIGLLFLICFFSACKRQADEIPKAAVTDATEAETIAQPAIPNPKAVDLSTAIITIAEQTIPAVVHIEVTQVQSLNDPFSSADDNPFFRFFFGPNEPPRKFKRELKGLGTGMIMDSKGYILTNNHVVANASAIQVLLADGKRYEAKVIGTDPKTDLAVIQIPVKDSVAFVRFGDSDKVRVGEWVVAIGHPRGLDQTVTQGIISAKHRTGITDPSNYQDFLQTDAAINPGNSGGPLLNLQGEVIGVNAMIASDSGGNEGIGFAIPSNMAVYISKQLIEHGKIQRGWIGVSIQDVTPELAKAVGYDGTRGAYVAEVVKGGPSEKAGLKKGDIVTNYQDHVVDDSGSFRNQVATSGSGQEVKVTVIRQGKKNDLKIKIGDLNKAVKFLSASVNERLGGAFRTLAMKESRKYGLAASQGILITRVDAKGLLGQAGFEVDDIILEINGQPIDNLENFINTANALQPGQKIIIHAIDHRTGNSGSVEVTVK